MPSKVVAGGGFDDLGSRSLLFLEAAVKLGKLTVRLWPGAARQKLTGKAPMFPPAKRHCAADSIQFVRQALSPPTQ